jgi:hypothetical protein
VEWLLYLNFFYLNPRNVDVGVIDADGCQCRSMQCFSEIIRDPFPFGSYCCDSTIVMMRDFIQGNEKLCYEPKKCLMSVEGEN